jgi:ElaB/YqjD/DUF883 family membrane-anchored ribosome-binding protein
VVDARDEEPAMERTRNDAHDDDRRAGEGLGALADRLAQQTEELRAAIGAYVAENPFTAMAVAFGAGYVLSGALFSRTTARMVGFGGRVIFGNLLRSMVAGMVPSLLFAALGDESGNGATRSAEQRRVDKSRR